MNRKRQKQIVIRMTESEYDTVKRKVDKSSKTQQQYLIEAITKKEVVSTDGLKAIIPELKRVGVNLNQIAKSCNEGNQATYNEIKEIEKELKSVWQLLRQLAAGRVLDAQ